MLGFFEELTVFAEELVVLGASFGRTRLRAVGSQWDRVAGDAVDESVHYDFAPVRCEIGGSH